MKNFEDWFKELKDESPEQTHNYLEKIWPELRLAWNSSINEVRNELVGRMETDYGLTINDDRQVVTWDNIEETLDKLESDYE